jgi:hypothetical protein
MRTTTAEQRKLRILYCNLMDEIRLRILDFDAIPEIALKFVQLLRFHRIAFLGSDDELWVDVNSPETGKVSATLVRSA